MDQQFGGLSPFLSGWIQGGRYKPEWNSHCEANNLTQYRWNSKSDIVEEKTVSTVRVSAQVVLDFISCPILVLVLVRSAVWVIATYKAYNSYKACAGYNACSGYKAYVSYSACYPCQISAKEATTTDFSLPELTTPMQCVPTSNNQTEGFSFSEHTFKI